MAGDLCRINDDLSTPTKEGGGRASLVEWFVIIEETGATSRCPKPCRRGRLIHGFLLSQVLKHTSDIPNGGS